jgi:hypothetical protein
MVSIFVNFSNSAFFEVWNFSSSLDVVKNSVVDGLDDVYYSNIEAREGYLSTLLID